MEYFVNARQLQKQLENLQQERQMEESQRKKKQEKILADKIRMELELHKRLKSEQMERENEKQLSEIKDSINITA